MLLSKKLFANKNQIIKKILQTIKVLCTNGQISKEQAKQIIAVVKTNILSKPSAESFEKALFDFSNTYPFFSDVLNSIKQDHSEFLEKISEAALENIMNEDPETWSTLLNELNETDESNFTNWFNKLPPIAKTSILPNL